jgi:hypothetical protein
MTSGIRQQGWKSSMGWRVASSALALGITLLWAAVAVRAQEAPAYTVLYTFTGADGANPQAALIRDGNGNLYGTTFSGGDLNKCGGVGCGVVFKITLHQ